MSTVRPKTLALAMAALTLATGIGRVHADTIVDPSTEYLNRIKVGETIQPLGETPFGESVSLYTGGISFRQTDISLPGIGPAITLTRTYEASGSPLTYNMDLPMADWGLATPELTTIVPGKRMGITGSWKVEEGVDPNARCTGFSPVSNPFTYGLPWRHGFQLISGDGDSQPVLKRTAENALAPSGNVAAFPLLTPRQWMISCLSQTSNGMPGEGFLVTAPDGTRYWLDHLAYGAPLETLIEAIPATTTAGGSTLVVPDDGTSDVYWGLDEEYMPRVRGHMFATRVEDRFGNWVRYRYAGEQLQEITASDGRHVVVTWRTDAPLVDNIAVQPGQADARIWRYEYSEPTNRAARMLVRVLQPDGTSWGLSMVGASTIKLGSPDPNVQCYIRTFTQIAADDNLASLIITHPSGLVGTFELSLRAHARSWVPTRCVERYGAMSPPSEDLPPVYLSLSLTRKTFSGPGVEPMSWKYLYSPAYGSTLSECQASGCPETQAVEVTDPGGSTTRFVHSNRWGVTEGKLLSVVQGVASPGSFAGSGAQVETTTYADTAATWPFPRRLGWSVEDPDTSTNTDPTEMLQPEVRRDIVRQDVTFSKETLGFDRFGQAETVRRSSSLGYSTTDKTEYWPVDAQWVLGLPWKTWSGARLVGQTDYDARLQVARTYNFGLLVGSYSYLPNGMLGTITDPLGNTTTLSNHKRGIPQSIQFANGTVVAPVIDDFGQVSSVTNQLGSTTTYAYDSAGRMTRLGYPVNDTVAWNPINRSFVRVGEAEFGLPPGHWKQVVQTGNAQVTTFYDAYWRPRLTLTEDVADPATRSFAVKQFDDAGRETFSAYPVATIFSVDQPLNGVRTSYDALGRRKSVTQDSELGSLVVSTDYLAGFRTRVTDARGFMTTTSYQVFDIPSEEYPVRIEAPEGITTVIVRDEFGKPKAITRSGPGG